jgi:hypothetical protein
VRFKELEESISLEEWEHQAILDTHTHKHRQTHSQAAIFFKKGIDFVIVLKEHWAKKARII